MRQSLIDSNVIRIHSLALLCVFLTTGIGAVKAQQYQAEDSIFIEQLLRGAKTGQGTLAFATQFKGRPYVAHTLEGNTTEQLVVNTRELDCTTFVETVAALTLCAERGDSTFQQYCRQLSLLRYRQGRLDGYTSRLHYFTDWIIDNSQMGFVEEVQQRESPFTAVQTLLTNYMSRHPQSYEALKRQPELVAVIAQQEQKLTGQRFRYIPKLKVRNSRELRQAVHDGDIIAITTSKAGLDIAHLGFAVWRGDGLHLLHASSLHHKVTEEPTDLGQYLQRHASHTGIRIIRLKQPAR